MALSFEIFEQKSIEARKLLYDVYVELEQFQKENSEFRQMEVNFYVWKFEQEVLISNKAYFCDSYLKWFNLGDFKKCEAIIKIGWAKNG